MKFLIVKPSSLGDILHAFPAVKMLLSAYPGVKVDWVVQPAFRDILEYFPDCERIIPFERKKLGSLKTFPAAFFNLLKELRKEKYAAVFDLQGLARSAAIASFARSSMYCGPATPKEPVALLFYGRKLSYAPELMHALEKNNSMLSDYLGTDRTKVSFHLPVLSKHADSARHLFRGSKVSFDAPELVAVAPGARWVSKQWEPEFFAAVITEIVRRRPGAQFVLLGTKSEKKSSEAILEQIKGLPMLDLCGETSLGELVEITRKASVFICNDSGPMHIAAALGTPVLALFGPTNPALTGPYSETKVVLQADLDCICCLKRYCDKEEIPCHAALDPLAAAEKTIQLMKGRMGQ